MLFRRKSTLQRVLDTVQHSFKAANDARPDLPDVDTGKARTAGLIAGGLAGLTVGSAALSSIRRRIDGKREDS